MEALWGMAHTGTPWRRLPAAYGKGSAVYRRQADGCGRGVGPRLMAMQADPEQTDGRLAIQPEGRTVFEAGTLPDVPDAP